MLYYLYVTLIFFCRIMYVAMFAYVVLSYVARNSRAFFWLGKFIYPFVKPFALLARKLSRRFASPFDLSILFAFVGLGIIQAVITWVYHNYLA